MILKIQAKLIWRFILFLEQSLKLRIFSVKWSILNKHNRTEVSRIFPLNCVEIGDNTYGLLNIHSFANGKNEFLKIGSYVSIADNVNFILGGNHNMKTFTTSPLKELLLNKNYEDSFSKGPILVEDEVWIGFGATILSGIRIGKGAIIAAGSLVNKDVEAYSIVGGNPAKLLKYRFSKLIIDKLIKTNLRDFEKQRIIENIDLFYADLVNPEMIDNISETVRKDYT